MHTTNPGLIQQSLDNNNTTVITSDTNTNLERLKQQYNGNTHNNTSISTQTNHDQINMELLTNSQKDILRLIGQHLQSVGLR